MAARTGWFRAVLLFWALGALLLALFFAWVGDVLLPFEIVDLSPCRHERYRWEESKRKHGENEIEAILGGVVYRDCVAEKGEDQSMIRYKTKAYRSAVMTALGAQTIWAIVIWGVYGSVRWIIAGFQRRGVEERR